MLAFQIATRAFVDLVIRSVESVTPGVSLALMRQMLALSDSGPTPSGSLARTLGVSLSSGTRMIDRLERPGLVERGTSPQSRSLVTLSLTEAGAETACRVLTWRYAEWQRLLAPLDPEDRRTASRVLTAVHEAVADSSAESQPWPVSRRMSW